MVEAGVTVSVAVIEVTSVLVVVGVSVVVVIAGMTVVQLAVEQDLEGLSYVVLFSLLELKNIRTTIYDDFNTYIHFKSS